MMTKISKKQLKGAYKFSKLYGCNKSFAYFRNKFRINPELFVLCNRNKNIIGICWGYARGEEAILIHIGVDAKYWKKGIGRRLLRFWERNAKNSGLKKASLGAAKKPMNTSGFYAKLGYRAVKEKTGYTIMEKKL